MLRGGISDRLISFAASLVGRLRGGLGQVNVLSSLFFGGVSGLGDRRRLGHRRHDDPADGQPRISTATSRSTSRSSAALVALLVPPSHNLILFSASAGGSISIADLFAAGIVPALLLTLALMVTVASSPAGAATRSEGLPGLRRGRCAASWRRCRACCWSLLIFVGIRAGIFTAIESASIAVCYATAGDRTALPQAFARGVPARGHGRGPHGQPDPVRHRRRPPRSAGCSPTCRCRRRRSSPSPSRRQQDRGPAADGR